MTTNILTKLTTTLRGKLSLWYLSSIGIIFTLFAMATGLFFWVTLQEQIDHHIHIVVHEAQQIVQRYQGQEREELIRSLVSAQGMTVILLSPDGNPIIETNSPDVALVAEHRLQAILVTLSLDSAEPVHFTQGDIRFAALPAQISAGKGIIAVGYSTQVLDSTIYTMLSVVAGVVVLLIIPATLIGHRLLKKQLQPLESIAQQASSVSDLTSLSRRIALSKPTQELRDIQQALNSMLQKLEDIFQTEREFFADAAHTLKTPLAVLRSQIENSTISNKSQTEIISTIDSAADTIQNLILLSTIGTNSRQSKTFSLSKLLTDLSELAATLAESRNIIVTQKIQTGIKLKADKQLISRAISNIIHNAIIYNQPGDKVSIQLKQTPQNIIITVKDNGPGISQADQTKVFSRFFRGSGNSNPGSGLGLAISKAVIESLGGCISLKSSPSHGTTITILIPTDQV